VEAHFGTMSPKERLAIASLLAVAALGHALRAVALGPSDAPGGLQLLSGVVPGDPAGHRAASARLGRPLRADEQIDLNRASVAELTRLPKVGPGLARRMVRIRDSLGGFASLGEVDAVPGVGPALFRAIGPHLALGDTLRIQGRRPALRGVAIPPPVPLPPNVVAGPEGLRGGSERPRTGPRVRVNSASQAELERLPGIGPSRAKAIVAYRQRHGPFASVADLAKVPGITRRLVTQMAPQVAIP